MRGGYSRSLKLPRRLVPPTAKVPHRNKKMANPSLDRAPAAVSELGPVSAPCVHALSPDVSARWDRFVLERPGASFFHQVGWSRVIEKTFGYQPCYFYAERD